MITQVSASEAHLLTVARTAVGLIPAADVMRLIVTSVTPPPKLGPTARAVLSDTLARGTVLGLARQGAWLNGLGGRGWDRHAPMPLTFTSNTVRLLQWVLRTPLGETDVSPLTLRGNFTLAEQVLVTLLLDALRGTGCDGALARQAPVRESPLVVLAHAAELARVAPLEAIPSFDVQTLAAPIDGLRVLLARSWLAAEKAKRDVDQPAVLHRIGAAQGAVLAAFFEAVAGVDHRPLATFLIDAAVGFFSVRRTPEDLIRAMPSDAPLRERALARRSAGAFVRALAHLRAWDQEHRSIRFIDDGYDVAQFLVKDWERLGEQGFNAAGQLVAELDAL
jgi:hypothetical protein